MEIAFDAKFAPDVRLALFKPLENVAGIHFE